MKIILRRIFYIISFVHLMSCSVKTETHIIETPPLKLTAIGPLFQGSNTATSIWEYSVKELFSEKINEIDIEDVRVSDIQIVPNGNVEYPNIGKIVMEVKPKNSGMCRIGLLENNFDTNSSNSLNVAEIQEGFNEAFKDERLTFVADFDMKDEEYFDDLKFDLIVTFEIQIRK